jgi:3-oxoisoapionate decarboxylase
MKIGIESYCYHRYFGDVYPEQQPLQDRWTMYDFISTAKRLAVDGVSLGTGFMPSLDRGFLQDLRRSLDHAGLDRVLAWGGRFQGLEMGANTEAIEDLRAHFSSADILGASVLRLTCANGAFRGREPVQVQIARMVPILKKLADEAGTFGITLGVENHGDFVADEIIELITKVDSPYLRVALDIGNFVQLNKDPVSESVKLAPYAVTTHMKDRPAIPHGSLLEGQQIWPSIGLGKGVIDVKAILQSLKDNNYDGLLSIELTLLPAYANEKTEVEDSVIYLRRTLPTLV